MIEYITSLFLSGFFFRDVTDIPSANLVTVLALNAACHSRHVFHEAP
jgi:hypothetical protein